MFYSEQKGMKMYALHLQMKEQREGHNPGALGLAGWKTPAKKTLIEMYRDGKLKYSQVSAVHDRLKKADHVEALKHGKVTESELEAEGVFIHSMRGGGKRKRKEPKDPSGGLVVAVPKHGDTNYSNDEIRKIMEAYYARQKEKQASEARAKKGFEVKPDEREAEEMLARHQNKGKCLIK